MSKVKFNVNTEYAYLSNFKVLQSTWSFHALKNFDDPCLGLGRYLRQLTNDFILLKMHSTDMA